MSAWTKYSFSIFTVTLLSCTLLPRTNIYEKGIESYQKRDYEKATKYFTDFYKKSPSGDSTLFYLYNCYVKTGSTESGIRVLEELAKRKNPNEQIYHNLFNYYRQHNLYYKINHLLLNSPSSVLQKIDQNYPLTQRLCAELFTGTTTNTAIKDPIIYAIKKGYLKPAPDGKLYETDTIKTGIFILLLDSFLPVNNPDSFYTLKNIRSDSYLYLPYMRLVASGIVNFDENINPEMNVPLSQAIQAINLLKDKGYIR